VQYTGGTPNADAFANFQDPANNMAFEVHQYLDTDSSGMLVTIVVVVVVVVVVVSAILPLTCSSHSHRN
jgi:endoglucanase